MKKITFIQPAIPKYRVPFFDKLHAFYDISIYTSNIDFLGVKTVYSGDKVNISPGFYSICKNKILWMKGLPLFSGYTKDEIVVINGNPRIINYMLLFAILKLKGIKTVWFPNISVFHSG